MNNILSADACQSLSFTEIRILTISVLQNESGPRE